MKRYGLGFVGAGAALVCFSMAGAALAQDISPPGRPTQQELQEIRSTYIVQFSSLVAPSEVAGRANAIAARFNGLIKHTYDTALKGFSIRMSEQALNNMIRTSGLGIVSVSRDGPVSVYAPPPGKGPNKDKDDTGGGDPTTCGESLGWNIGRVTTMTQAPYSGSGDGSCLVNGSTQMDLSGTLLKVCVIDTGVSSHPDLNVESNKGKNFSSDKGGPKDLNGHGTHVAGIIGAIANGDSGAPGEGVVGVAPGTPIIPIKVLNRRGSGSFSGVIAGVDYAASIGCDIANMSLGGETSSTALDTAVQNAASIYDVSFTIAAGNSAEDLGTHSPARASTSATDNIFTIASFGQSSGSDLWSYFSNYDLDPNTNGMIDFALPGGGIRSTWIGNGYNTISGTSMAAPHMAGLLVRLGGTSHGEVANNAFDDGGSVERMAYPSGNSTGDDYDVPSDDDNPLTP